MRRSVIRWCGLVAIVLSIAGLVWWFGSPKPAIHTPAPQTDRAHVRPGESVATKSGALESPRVPAPASQRKNSARAVRAERDALKRAIDARQHQAPSREAPPQPGNSQQSQEQAGGLKNRLGGREALVAYLNKDFTPLAVECIRQAQEESPQLRGMLAMGIEIATDEQLGGVIDTAEAAPTNEVSDRGLLECIRETALTVILPPRLTSGREKFELTLRVEPHPERDPAP